MQATELVPNIDETALATLAAEFRGELLQPDDAGYDDARRVWNGTIDRHPGLIARCRGVADVIRAVDFARTQHLLVAVRGGGHHVAGNAACDDGIVIDLSQMTAVHVDPVSRRARVQAGARWRDVDHETQAFGLATVGGIVSSTGVAGLTLGGGIGWLMRKHGMTCDNLVSVDLVTADGRFLTASEDNHADLFWALRGGGGNFGIATSFEFALHEVGPVLGGLVLFGAEDAAKVLRGYSELLRDCPDELCTFAAFMHAPPEEWVPSEAHNAPAVALIACWAGPIAQGEQALAPYRALGEPIADAFGPMPYVALQSMFDAEWPDGTLTYWKSIYLPELSDAAIDVLCERAWPSPMSEIHLHQLGGLAGRIDDRAAAAGNRSAALNVNVVGLWEDPEDEPVNVAWARETWHALQPSSTGAPYLNFLGDEGAELVAAAYGAETYERLRAIKRKYDPGNFFRLNQNVPPARA